MHQIYAQIHASFYFNFTQKYTGKEELESHCNGNDNVRTFCQWKNFCITHVMLFFFYLAVRQSIIAKSNIFLMLLV